MRGPTPTKHKGPLQYGLDEINGNTYCQRCSNCSVIEDFDSLISQVNQGLTVYGNKGSTDQHAWVFHWIFRSIWYIPWCRLCLVLMHLFFYVVIFNNWEKVCTISLWHSLRCFVIDPLVMIGSLNLVWHVATTSFACYRLDLFQPASYSCPFTNLYILIQFHTGNKVSFVF